MHILNMTYQGFTGNYFPNTRWTDVYGHLPAKFQYVYSYAKSLLKILKLALYLPDLAPRCWITRIIFVFFSKSENKIG